jgi:hypothetical protein
MGQRMESVPQAHPNPQGLANATPSLPQQPSASKEDSDSHPRNPQEARLGQVGGSDSAESRFAATRSFAFAGFFVASLARSEGKTRRAKKKGLGEKNASATGRS